MSRTVTILCSGFGLGFYIPGLLVAKGLQNKNVKTDVLVFESYMESDKKAHINDSRKAYHENFSLAKGAAKLPMDIRKSIDYERVDELLEQWRKENRRDFISLSGHWIYILDMYREKLFPESINVDLLYVDSYLAPSWRSLKRYNPQYNQLYNERSMYNLESMDIIYRIDVKEIQPKPLEKRKDRLVVHGGGWGMGTYQSKIPELMSFGFNLDIVVYDFKEADTTNKANRYFMNNPSWSAWIKSENGLHEFPPYCEIRGGEVFHYPNNKDNHWLFDITEETKAIIAKPGAGTLIDSLASATPLVLLEPFGKHEQKNLELWEHLGLGIKYEKWKESGFSMNLLEEIHQRLLTARDKGSNYADYFYTANGFDI